MSEEVNAMELCFHSHHHHHLNNIRHPESPIGRAICELERIDCSFAEKHTKGTRGTANVFILKTGPACTAISSTPGDVFTNISSNLRWPFTS